MKARQLLHELGQSLSLEVSPTLAHDTAGTLAAARDLFARADRPNLLIKIPGTKEGPRYRRMKEAL